MGFLRPLSNTDQFVHHLKSWGGEKGGMEKGKKKRKRKMIGKVKMESKKAVSVIVVVWGQVTPLAWRHVSPVSHVIMSIKGVHSSYKMLK
jgi:hypothetical protein